QVGRDRSPHRRTHGPRWRASRRGRGARDRTTRRAVRRHLRLWPRPIGSGRDRRHSRAGAFMSANDPTRERAALVGVGAVACVACWAGAGPIVGFVAAAGLVTLVGIAFFGIAGTAIAVLAVLLYVRRRRRSRTAVLGATEAAAVRLARKPDV